MSRSQGEEGDLSNVVYAACECGGVCTLCFSLQTPSNAALLFDSFGLCKVKFTAQASNNYDDRKK